MEEQEKQETLSKLYTLRAGLSAVALEKEQADQILTERYESEIQQNYQMMYKDGNLSLRGGREEKSQEIERLINVYNSWAFKDIEEIEDVKQIQEEFEQHNIGINYNKGKSEQYALEAKKAKKHEKTLKAWSWILGLVAIPILLFGSWMINGNFGDDEYIRMVLFLSATCIGGAFLVLAIVFRAISGKPKDQASAAEEKSYDYLELVRSCENKRDLASKSLSNKKKEWQEVQEKDRKRLQALEKGKQAVEKLYLAAGNDEEIQQHVETANVIYWGLQNEFQTVLDERDWGNLDFVIFMLETGRADSMKEALQLVDRERQTDKIVEAVKYATRAISGTISDGFRRLGSLVTECCSRLSAQLKGVSEQMSLTNQNMQAQSRQLRDMGQYMSSLTSEIALGNALQAKANETSLVLAQEARKLKGYAEYADWRLRNA